MRIRSLLASVALVLFPQMVSAQQIPAEGVTLVGPGKFAGVFEETASLTVESIDKATRSVVLQRANGEMLRMVAGDEVRNFDQIKVGDKVVSRHTQALVLELKKGGAGVRERVESTDQGLAKPGEKPSAYEAKKITFVADVQKVDLKTQIVTLRGAKKTLQLKVKDPEQLKLIKKGDQVEGVYAEAVAISVIAAPAKAKK
jgi:Cu/Ag efflux protein CusF